jgi:hypothetical protein
MVAVLGAIGCSGDDSDLPEFSGGSPGGSAATGTAEPGASGSAAAGVSAEVPKRGTKLGDEDNAITVGKMAKADAAEEAVQAAYLAFWVERARALRLAKVDRAALDKVASGEAVRDVTKIVSDLAAEKQHAEGGSTVNVRTTKVSGGTATLTDCLQDLSVTVDAEGDPLDAPDLQPVPFTATLVKGTDGGWRVTELVQGEVKNCG